MFEYVRQKVGFEPKLIHDVHSKLSGSNALLFSKKMEPVHIYFVEDLLPPEQVAWYKEVRQVCATSRIFAARLTASSLTFPVASLIVLSFAFGEN